MHAVNPTIVALIICTFVHLLPSLWDFNFEVHVATSNFRKNKVHNSGEIAGTFH